MILDGEMMTYDPIADEFLPFGRLRSVTKGEQGVEVTSWLTNMVVRVQAVMGFPCWEDYAHVVSSYEKVVSIGSFFFLKGAIIDVVFDILKVNDKSLLQFSLETRRRFLNQLIQPERGTLHILHHETGSTIARVLEVLDQVLLAKGEGVVIKDPESPYRPGVRGTEWIKIKPDYMTEMGEHLDVVIIGQ
jgi:ATP-dependent DNA ligase